MKSRALVWMHLFNVVKIFNFGLAVELPEGSKLWPCQEYWNIAMSWLSTIITHQLFLVLPALFSLSDIGVL
jgi:hypothetical protein